MRLASERNPLPTLCCLLMPIYLSYVLWVKKKVTVSVALSFDFRSDSLYHTKGSFYPLHAHSFHQWYSQQGAYSRTVAVALLIGSVCKLRMQGLALPFPRSLWNSGPPSWCFSQGFTPWRSWRWILSPRCGSSIISFTKQSGIHLSFHCWGRLHHSQVLLDKKY